MYNIYGVYGICVVTGSVITRIYNYSAGIALAFDATLIRVYTLQFYLQCASTFVKCEHPDVYTHTR